MKRIIKKYELLLTAATLSLLFFAHFDATAWADDEFRIISAKYGIPGNYRDVTQTVRDFVSDHSISMKVSNENLGVDPTPNQEKEFVVIYRKQGREYGAHLQEGSWFIVID